jgi:hypothetical protein
MFAQTLQFKSTGEQKQSFDGAVRRKLFGCAPEGFENPYDSGERQASLS